MMMRSQASVEFMFMIMSATSMILIFMVMFSELYQDNLSDKRRIIVEDYAYSVQNEFIVASQTLPGYKREFYVPDNLEGHAFELSIINSVLVFNYSQSSFSLPIPPVKGDIKKGQNIIQNINNTLIIR